MEIITEWRLYVINGGYFISHFQLIVCDLEEIPSKTKGLPSGGGPIHAHVPIHAQPQFS